MHSCAQGIRVYIPIPFLGCLRCDVSLSSAILIFGDRDPAQESVRKFRPEHAERDQEESGRGVRYADRAISVGCVATEGLAYLMKWVLNEAESLEEWSSIHTAFAVAQTL